MNTWRTRLIVWLALAAALALVPPAYQPIVDQVIARITWLAFALWGIAGVTMLPLVCLRELHREVHPEDFEADE